MRYKCLAASLWVAALVAPVSAQSVKAGIDAWQKADYSAAVSIWRPLAEQGDADAQFNLGQAYRLGRGVPVNLAAAQIWFERAAGKGHVDAQTTLGLLLCQNGNHTGGLRWLKAAADKGEPRAMLVYGTALYNGDGVPQDPTLGYAYVARSAGQGLRAARDTLAQLDDMMPAEDRRKSTALALKLKSAPAPSAKPEKTAAAAKPSKPSQAAAAQATTKAGSKPSQTATAHATTKAGTKPSQTAAKESTAKAATKPSPTVAKAGVAATGNWRVQLGAFSKRSSAEALYRKLSGHKALAGRQAHYVAAGPVTRLQVGPFGTHTEAAAACRALGQACFPVSAK